MLELNTPDPKAKQSRLKRRPPSGKNRIVQDTATIDQVDGQKPGLAHKGNGYSGPVALEHRSCKKAPMCPSTDRL